MPTTSGVYYFQQPDPVILVEDLAVMVHRQIYMHHLGLCETLKNCMPSLILSKKYLYIKLTLVKGDGDTSRK